MSKHVSVCSHLLPRVGSYTLHIRRNGYMEHLPATARDPTPEEVYSPEYLSKVMSLEDQVFATSKLKIRRERIIVERRDILREFRLLSFKCGLRPGTIDAVMSSNMKGRRALNRWNTVVEIFKREGVFEEVKKFRRAILLLTQELQRICDAIQEIRRFEHEPTNL